MKLSSCTQPFTKYIYPQFQSILYKKISLCSPQVLKIDVLRKNNFKVEENGTIVITDKGQRFYWLIAIS